MKKGILFVVLTLFLVLLVGCQAIALPVQVSTQTRGPTITPTPEPTPVPTLTPTPEPTPSPTPEPTPTLSVIPTETSTTIPTITPTTSPTINPTSTPQPASDYLITINKTTIVLALYRVLPDGKLMFIRTYGCTIGSYDRSPSGQWKILEKEIDPYWGGAGQPGVDGIAGGDPSNPLGSRWMGLSSGEVPGWTYGIHGTNMPWTIGTACSLGCHRMRNEDAEELYDIVPKGTPVWIGFQEDLALWGIQF